MREEFKNIRKLYHYTKFDTAIEILKSNSLRFGRLCNMNDIHENDKLSYVDIKGTPINSFPSDVLDAIYCEMEKYRQISLTADDDQQDKLGFDLHQMWGLYADKGQGVCLVFDKNILFNKFDAIDCQKIDCHKKVSYDNTIESFYISIFQDPQSVQQDIQNQIEKIFFHKRKEWEHEQEYRFVKYCPNLKKEEYLDYGDALKFIILNSAIEDIDAVRFKKRVEVLNVCGPHIPKLIYGNGLLGYSLIDINHTKTFWNSSNGYDILIPGENCEIDI